MEKFAEYYNRVLDGIIALGSKPVVINLIPVYGKRYFDWFSRKLDPKALMRFLGSTESIEHWNEMYNLAVMRIAARRGRAQCVPAQAQFRGPLQRGRHPPQPRRPPEDV